MLPKSIFATFRYTFCRNARVALLAIHGLGSRTSLHKGLSHRLLHLLFGHIELLSSKGILTVSSTLRLSARWKVTPE